ncbi:hypothetical protein [Azonexus sp.]|uniref:hypothetical protein n=1 Tax=Azonexus sp. TaxID=1872668 RepID=UPI0035AD815B
MEYQVQDESEHYAMVTLRAKAMSLFFAEKLEAIGLEYRDSQRNNDGTVSVLCRKTDKYKD